VVDSFAERVVEEGGETAKSLGDVDELGGRDGLLRELGELGLNFRQSIGKGIFRNRKLGRCLEV